MKIAEQVDKGQIQTNLSFSTRQILNETFDLCHNLHPVNLSCPFHPGNYIRPIHGNL